RAIREPAEDPAAQRTREEAERVDARRLHELRRGAAAGEERAREVQRRERVDVEIEPLDQIARRRAHDRANRTMVRVRGRDFGRGERARRRRRRDRAGNISHGRRVYFVAQVWHNPETTSARNSAGYVLTALPLDGANPGGPSSA